MDYPLLEFLPDGKPTSVRHYACIHKHYQVSEVSEYFIS